MTYLTAEGKHTVYSSEESFAQAFIRYTNLELQDVKHSFVKIGFRLAEAKRERYYEELGYASIEELAEKEFGFKSTVTNNLMQIWRFCHDEKSPMQVDARFDKYNQSQLLEMSRSKHSFDNYRLAAIVPENATKEEVHKIIKEWNRWESVHGLSNEEILRCIQTPPLLEAATGAYEEEFHPGGKSEVEVRTEEELRVIDECLRRDAFKNTIYRKCLALTSKSEFVEFLKDIHGYSGGEWKCGEYFFRNYDKNKGIILRGKNDDLTIKWSEAADRIRGLIEAKQYLTEDELGLNKDKPAPVVPEWTDGEAEGQFHPGGKAEEITDAPAEPAPAPVTDEELIKTSIKRGPGIHNGKFELVEFYNTSPTQYEFVKYVTGQYEFCNRYNHGWFGNIEVNCKTFTIHRESGGKIVMPWTVVAGHISRLITAGEYLSESEQERYGQWQAGKGGVTEQAEEEPEEFSAYAENVAELTPRRQQTMREYLATVPDEEFVGRLLVKILNLYPFNGKSALFTSTVRAPLTEWLNSPYEVKE